MLRVGLTGGIASGKSHVLRRMGAAGFRTLDLDAVSREIMTRGGTAHADVVAAFGPGVVAGDGTIDRHALGHVVFSDAAARRRLEAIVHPRIRRAEDAALAASGPESVAVVDAALLVETGLHLRYDRLVVVACEPQEQLCRLMARDGITEASARARIDAQMPVDEKRRFGHYVIDTSATTAETDERTDAVVESLRAVAARPPVRAHVPAERAVAMMERGPRVGPRGLTPWRVLEAVADVGPLDLARLAASLEPPHDGPWYLAAASPAGERPESLAIAVALFARGRRPGDAAYTVGAAASLARLTHREDEAIAGAVLAALAADHALVSASDASSLRGMVGAWARAAARGAGSPPPPSVVDTIFAAAAHPGDRDAAAAAAQVAGGLPPLARALAGGPSPAAPAGRIRTVEKVLAGALA